MASKLAQIQDMIYEIRGQKVMLDRDLADLYGVELRSLNQAVKRNIRRFPSDFMFQLTDEEWQNLRSQIVIFNKDTRKYKPYAFTEQGVSIQKPTQMSKLLNYGSCSWSTLKIPTIKFQNTTRLLNKSSSL